MTREPPAPFFTFLTADCQCHVNNVTLDAPKIRCRKIAKWWAPFISPDLCGDQCQNYNLATLSQVALSVCLILNAIEFVCFVVIFVELFKHHKRHVALCLANKPKSASSKEKREVCGAKRGWPTFILKLSTCRMIPGRVHLIMAQTVTHFLMPLWAYSS